MVRPASNARSIPCWQSPRFARESGRSLFPTEHRRFKRGAVSIGAPFRRVETAHDGCSENFWGDGRIFLGGRHAEPPGAILANENSDVLASLPSNLVVRRECRIASRLSLSLKST